MTDERRRLHVAADEPGPLDRHPDDGWRLADPYPMGRATEKVTRAIIRALLPPPPAPTTPDMEDVVYRHVRVMLQYMPPLAAKGFVLLLHALDWSPLWRFRGLLPITAIPTGRASAVLQGIAVSSWLPIRMMMIGPKGLILSTYFNQDVVGERLGWAPKPFMRDRIALRKRLLAGEAARPEDMIHHIEGLATVVAAPDPVPVASPALPAPVVPSVPAPAKPSASVRPPPAASVELT